jgi:predicted ATPase/DNA-binding SARP family transcriptional activator
MSELNLDTRDPDQRLWYVELLGSVRINMAGQIVTQFSTQKESGLLAYLALRPGPHPRERLIDLFWPDLDLPAGRNNLSTTLVSLRRRIEPAGIRRGSVLVTSHSEVGLNPDAVTTDVVAFEDLLKRAARTEDTAKRADLLGRASALYRGDLLPGNYMDWAVREAERLQARLQEALRQLAKDREMLGDLSGALDITRRLCGLDPFAEEEHCRLIRLYVQTGNTTAAREAHRRFERLMAEEFGAAPAAATQQLVSRLLSQPSAAPRVVPWPPATPVPATVEPAPNLMSTAADADEPPGLPVLPVVLTRFFGREAELDQLARLLLPRKGVPAGPEAVEPPCRLVTLTGPGGMGKTRLSIEFARQAATRFAAWCGFVSLVELTDASQMDGALAQALKLPPDPDIPPLERIIARLQQVDRPDAPTLLILDNLEHLLAKEEDAQSADPMTAVVRSLLERVPGLTILATSRRRLGIRGERLVLLAPLSVPEAVVAEPDADQLLALAAMPGVRLYIDRAQAVRPDFGLTTANAPAVAALCRQLEGSPLALELAAAWVRVLPPRKMWERLTQGMDIPSGSYADLPARHRTLTAALDWSFRLLTATQQRLLARLSVFQGGWTVEAAQAVCEEPEALTLLGQLQEASLVTVMSGTDDEGEVRYGFLETVRAFCRGRLQEQGEQEAMQRRHASAFLALVEQAREGMSGEGMGIWVARLTAEYDNLRAALRWLREAPDGVEDGMLLAGLLMRYWELRGYMAEGMETVLAALARPGAEQPTQARARALNTASNMALHLADYEQARDLQQEALALWEQLGNRRGVAGSLHNLANIVIKRDNYLEAHDLYLQALAINREMGNQEWETFNLNGLAGALAAMERFDEAIDIFDQSVSLSRQNGNRYNEASALSNQARVLLQMNALALAQQRALQALEVARETGNRFQEPYVCFCLGEVARQHGELTTANEWFCRALTAAREQGNRREVLTVLEYMAPLRTSQGHLVQAAHLYGFAARQRRLLDVGRETVDAIDYERNLAATRIRLSADEFNAAHTAGEKMTLKQGIAYALQETSA